jgi:hypothetical protein
VIRWTKGSAMIGTASMRNGGWRRAALFLVACALLFRIAIPAGWMPQAHAQGVTLAWCSGMGDAAPAEAKALIAKAIGAKETPKHKPTSDQPCAFAAAAHPVAHADPVPLLAPVVREAVAIHPALLPFPGRGLVAPPPFATGPPLHA